MVTWDLSQACKDFSISDKQCDTPHQKKSKNKNHTIITIDAEKAFDKIQNPLIIKKKTNLSTLCIPMDDSCCSLTENNKILQSNYPSI